MAANPDPMELELKASGVNLDNVDIDDVSEAKANAMLAAADAPPLPVPAVDEKQFDAWRANPNAPPPVVGAGGQAQPLSAAEQKKLLADLQIRFVAPSIERKDDANRIDMNAVLADVQTIVMQNNLSNAKRFAYVNQMYAKQQKSDKRCAIETKTLQRLCQVGHSRSVPIWYLMHAFLDAFPDKRDLVLHSLKLQPDDQRYLYCNVLISPDVTVRAKYCRSLAGRINNVLGQPDRIDTVAEVERFMDKLSQYDDPSVAFLPLHMRLRHNENGKIGNFIQFRAEDFQKLIGALYAEYEYRPPVLPRDVPDGPACKVSAPCKQPSKDPLKYNPEDERNRKFTPSQEFVRHWLNPRTGYKGLLAVHSVGSGKTCMAWAAATSYFYQQEWAVLWVTPGTLKKAVWGNVMQDLCNLELRSLFRNKPAEARTESEMYEYLSKSMDHFVGPITYKQLCNMADGAKVNLDPIQQHHKQIGYRGKDRFYKTLIIMDEVHKLFSGRLDKSVSCELSHLFKLLQYSYAVSREDSCRVLMMTATPIVCHPVEVCHMLNCLIPQELQASFPTTQDEFAAVFLDPETEFTRFTENGIRKFMELSKGLISFVDGSNDLSVYPNVQKWHIVHVPMLVDQEKAIKNCLKQYPTPSQRDNQKRCVQQVSEFTYPRSDHFMFDSKNHDFEESWKLHLKQQSPRMNFLLKLIDQVDKADYKKDHLLYKWVIYCDGEDGFTLKNVASALMAAGYKIAQRRSGKNIIMPSVEQIPKDEARRVFAVMTTRPIWRNESGQTSSIPESGLEGVKAVFNMRGPCDGNPLNEKNEHGQIIRFLLIDKTVSEGHDLFDVQRMVFFGPVLSELEEQQAFGRVNRRCGAKGLTFYSGIGTELFVMVLSTDFGADGLKANGARYLNLMDYLYDEGVRYPEQEDRVPHTGIKFGAESTSSASFNAGGWKRRGAQRYSNRRGDSHNVSQLFENSVDANQIRLDDFRTHITLTNEKGGIDGTRLHCAVANSEIISQTLNVMAISAVDYQLNRSVNKAPSFNFAPLHAEKRAYWPDSFSRDRKIDFEQLVKQFVPTKDPQNVHIYPVEGGDFQFRTVVQRQIQRPP